MPLAPAVCNKCHAIFASGFNIAGKNATLSGCTAGPCPACGGLGTIPDGVYSALSDTILAYKAGHINEAALRRLATLLESARTTEDEPQKVAERIKSDIPELASVASALPNTRNELYAFLAVLIALLTVLIDTCGPEAPPRGHDIRIEKMDVEQAIDITIKNMYENPKKNGQ